MRVSTRGAREGRDEMGSDGDVRRRRRERGGGGKGGREEKKRASYLPVV